MSDELEAQVETLEEEAARLLLARLRKLLPAVKRPIVVAYFSGNNPQRYGEAQETHIKGGGFWLYGQHPEKGRFGDQNRGTYEGDALVLDAQGQLRFWEWDGSWSQWQDETCHYQASGLGEGGLEDDADYRPRRTLTYTTEVGTVLADEEVLQYVALEDLAAVVAQAEKEALERRQAAKVKALHEARSAEPAGPGNHRGTGPEVTQE